MAPPLVVREELPVAGQPFGENIRSFGAARGDVTGHAVRRLLDREGCRVVEQGAAGGFVALLRSPPTAVR